MGLLESKDYTYPICVEELINFKVVDVGCGLNFTVVITTESYNSVAYENYK